MIRDPGQFTQRLLTAAGLREGHRVLDVGCGTGDLALLAAGLVGPTGSVVGIDRDPAALTAARARTQAPGHANVTFAEGDLASVGAEHGTFDAAIGRRVLMYQADAAAALRGLARALKPGGVVVFQEHDATLTPASPAPMPLHAQAVDWMWRTVKAEGGNLHMGFELGDALKTAGLQVEHVRAEATVQTRHDPHPIAWIVRAMETRIVQHGVATAAELDVDTLEERLAEERDRIDTTYVVDLVFGAWARMPCSDALR